jgi:protein-tyrosine-phosphatase
VKDFELAAAQAAVMAEPDRLRLLALVLTDPSGQPTAVQLAGFGRPVDAVVDHLETMADVWLLARVGHPSAPGYRPTADAILRFGGAAIGAGSTADGPVVDPGEHKPLLDRLIEEFTAQYADVFARETVQRFVLESYALLAARASVQRFLPALTARFAADRLSALAQPYDAAMRPARSRSAEHPAGDVLFVCVRNSGRSQIAAATMRALAGDRVRVRTAGTVPASAMDPAVRTELKRRGLDGLAELPRPLTDEVVRASGVVVTMGCGEACPVFPGRRYVDWPLDDPAGKPPREVRRIADEIAERVQALLAEIDAAANQ